MVHNPMRFWIDHTQEYTVAVYSRPYLVVPSQVENTSSSQDFQLFVQEIFVYSCSQWSASVCLGCAHVGYSGFLYMLYMLNICVCAQWLLRGRFWTDDRNSMEMNKVIHCLNLYEREISSSCFLRRLI